MEKYIGLDVHAASTTFPVIGESGRRLTSHVVETNGQALVEQLKTIPGNKHVCLEEGTQSAWIYEILSPYAKEIVVTMVPESRGQKDDQRDAFALAERLRTGAIERKVFKEVGEYKALRELGRTHAMVVQDVVRVQNRIKALFRSRGVAVSGKGIYSEEGREEFLETLPEASRGAAKTLYAQYEAVEAIRRQAEKDLVTEAHRHPISRVLETCPGLGPIRVAQLLPIVVSPGRFRTKRQVLVVLRPRHRDALVVGLGPEAGWWLGTGGGAEDARPESEPQSYAQVDLQGRGGDRDLAARSRSLAPGLPAAPQRGHEAEPRKVDDRPQARCHRSFDVEEQGEVRPDEASQARFIARPTCGNVNPREGCDRWRSWRRARFEGEHPWTSWPGGSCPEVPRVGYAPSEYRKKPWPEEVQIEGWFPLLAREHQCFDLVEDAIENLSRRERPSSALASGSDANRGREADREAPKARRTSRLNPGKPRRTSRLGADASVEEDGGRSGEICLDTTFH
jgi:hypothetical protein